VARELTEMSTRARRCGNSPARQSHHQTRLQSVASNTRARHVRHPSTELSSMAMATHSQLGFAAQLQKLGQHHLGSVSYDVGSTANCTVNTVQFSVCSARCRVPSVLCRALYRVIPGIQNILQFLSFFTMIFIIGTFCCLLKPFTNQQCKIWMINEFKYHHESTPLKQYYFNGLTI